MNAVMRNGRRAAVVLGALGAAANIADAQVLRQSVRSGPWTAPSTWSPFGIPDALDTVVIREGHTVYLAHRDTSYFPNPNGYVLDIRGLTVDGELLTNTTPGYGRTLYLNTNVLNVGPTGSIRAQDTNAYPSNIRIQVWNSTTPVTIRGTIQAGNGLGGGWVTLRADTAPINVLGGQILAGHVGAGQPVMYWAGDAYVTGRNVHFTRESGRNALLRAGNGRGYMAGHAMVSGSEFAILSPGSHVRAGDNLSQLARGGDATLRSAEHAMVDSGASVRAGLPHFVPPNWRLGSWARVCARVTFVFGNVEGGRIDIEPEELTISGDARIEGDLVRIGSRRITLNALNDPPAIRASDSIEAFVPNQGLFDLSGNPVGPFVLESPRNVMHCDAFLTDGPPPDNFMGGPVEFHPGRPMRELCISGEESGYLVRPGETAILDMTAFNCGGQDEGVFVTLRDTCGGWLVDSFFDVFYMLQPHETFDRIAYVNIPDWAPHGSECDLVLELRSMDNPELDKRRTVRLIVSNLMPCPADFNNDGQADFFDYLDFVLAFDSADPAADFNGDGQIDFFDYLDFVIAFDAGC